MIPEREREALMRLTMCAREECIMCKYHKECDFDFQCELATKNMNILADALRKTENSSEKPNNCEHITEDGVTCAKYPACDDCLDNPLNKVKGSERLVKGSEQTDLQDWKDRMWAEAIVTEPTISKMEQVDKDINVRSKDEPQIYGNEHNCIMTLFGDCSYAETGCGSCEVVEKVRKALGKYEPTDEPQTERDE